MDEHAVGASLRDALAVSKPSRSSQSENVCTGILARTATGHTPTAARAPDRPWVTDLPVGEDNLMDARRAGAVAACRWARTGTRPSTNTLKNQGYAFGHNFGHGGKQLSTVLAHLMMLAFLIDRIQQRYCAVSRRARARAKRPGYPWGQVRAAFLLVAVPDWETLYALATKDRVAAVAVVDTW